TFDLRTYMTGWTDQTTPPAHGPLFQACLGGSAGQWGGGTVVAASNGVRITFSLPHNLSPGQAGANANELRFVTTIIDSQSIQLNAPFTSLPPSGAALVKTVTYQPASELGSVSIFDYWTPCTSAQRILSGAAIDQF